MDWLDLLAVQGTLKSILQHHTSKASILQCSAFFIVQISHPYMTTGKTIALTRWAFVDKVMSLLFNMLSRLVITLLPKSKHLLISWLQSPSAVILEPPKIKSVTVSTVSPFICREVMGPDAMMLVFWMFVLSQLFHSPLPLSLRGSLVLLHFLYVVYINSRQQHGRILNSPPITSTLNLQPQIEQFPLKETKKLDEQLLHIRQMTKTHTETGWRGWDTVSP